MKVLFVASEPTIAVLFLPIAQAFRKISPSAEIICINPSELLCPEVAEGGSPTEVFAAQGFAAEDIKKADYNDLSGLDYESKACLFYFRLYKLIDPSVVVVPHEFGYAFYAVQVAKHRGISTYHIQHGIWGPDRFFPRTESPLSASDKKKDICGKILSYTKAAIRILFSNDNVLVHKKKPHDLELLHELNGKLIRPPTGVDYFISADRMAVWGPYYEKLLSEAQSELKSRLDVVGYIPGDNFYYNQVESMQTINNRYGMDGNRRLTIYFYTPFQEFPRSYTLKHHPTDVLIETVRQLKKIDRDINVLVVLHPNYRFSYYKSYLTDIIKKNNFMSVRIDRIHNDHFSLYKSASLIIGVKSTMFYEAMLVNTIGVLQPYVLSEIYDPQHIEKGAIVPVFCPHHLHKQLEMALMDESVRSRIKENQKMVCDELLGQFDGRCGERVALALLNLMKCD